MTKNNKPATRETPRECGERLGLKFSDWFLLNRALTHRSYLNEHPEALEDNERLEFLGDAVLDFVVGAWLYHRYPEMPEGGLTRMRSALVHTQQLANFSQQISLGNALQLGRGEIVAGGYNRPALLCDTFEALIGAIYLDMGIESAWNFIASFLESTADEIYLNHKEEDPKGMFQEWAQARGLETPQYITQNMIGPDHARVFEVNVTIDSKVYGRGKGHSKQAATKVAARNALITLGLID